LHSGQGIIDYLRSSAKFEKQVESFRVYLTNQEAMLALKVRSLFWGEGHRCGRVQARLRRV